MAMNTNFFEAPINIDRVCRLCLIEGTNLSPIFSTEQQVDEFSGLPQKIQACGSIEIHENDGFPSLICHICIYKISVAHEFRQQCQQSDTRLRLLFDKPTRTEAATEPTTRVILSRKMPSPTTTYYVKQEMQTSTQDYANAIEAYSTQVSRVEAVRSDDHHPIDCHEEKMFLCNIGYEGTKDNPITEKPNTIMRVESHEVDLPIVQAEISTTLMSIDANGQLETQQLIVKSDDGKCSNEAAIMEDEEYLNEQLLEDETNMEESMDSSGDGIAGNEEDFEEQQQQQQQQQEQQDDVLRQEQEEREESTMKKRSSRKRGQSYSDDNDDDDDDEIEDYDYGSLSNEAQASRPKYKCNVCRKRYMTEKGLKNHAIIHEKNHKCSVCDKAFFKIKNLMNHEKIHEIRPHSCRTCHTSFSKLPSLERHLKSHVETIKTDDNEDKSAFLVPSKNELIIPEGDPTRSDLETDDEETIAAAAAAAASGTNNMEEFDNSPCQIYKCESCGQFCSSLKNLKRHSLVHGDKKYSCTVCKKWFFRPDTLKRHAEKHGHGLIDNLVDDNKLFESDDETFSSIIQQQQQQQQQGGGEGVSNNENEKTRDDTSAGEDDNLGEYKCQHCDKIMATKKGLRRHVSMHKPKAEPATCEICKKVCASQARLGLHLKTHNKPKEKTQREFLCHICSKVYPSNSSLTYHMRTHTGVKPHVCKICNSGFTTTTSLANHIRIHTGDKPFVCHVCSAAFAVSSAFRRHLTRHTGEANYLCKTCGKAFKRLSTLKEHTYTHSGEKPYVCKTCGAAYSHSGSLFAHQKRCRVQYGEIEHAHAHHIHVNNVQTAVRSLAVIGQMY